MAIVWKGSPNSYKGRKNTTIDRIVIHWFGSGTLESANDRFQNAANQVSAHYGISKGRIWQWVKEEDTSYNAGNWPMNLRCIGIEHDATLNGHDLSEEDYQNSGALIASIAKRHNIPLDRQHVIGHREVKPTACPGTVNIDKLIAIAKGVDQPPAMMRLNVQLVFDNQKLGNELALCVEANQRMRMLTNDKVDLEFLDSIYTSFKDIPTELNMSDPNGDAYRAVQREWFIRNVFSINPRADVIILVGANGDWDNAFQNGPVLSTTFGLYYSNVPTTFPGMIQIVAAGHDTSWRYPEYLSAFVHYVTHEISHLLFQAAEVPDRCHELDYKSVDGLHEALPALDYSLIAKKLALKTNYMTEFPVFKSENDGTLYAHIGGFYLEPIAADWNKFVKDFPGAKVVTLSPNEMLKYKVGGETLIKNRK